MRAHSKDWLAGVVIAPHVSEKAARVATEGNQYVFRVRRDATKPEIRAAVEFLFEVKVDKVRVVNQPGKEKRFGRTLGRRSDWKKAYVRLEAGQQIEMGGSERA
ncbi:MAG TPA: 50S ribosomal protein L23 [Steroidobacteraceae bacterium]|nr:50S ribosomal protein L23 [Steroidobacteraceae bacterium]